MFVLSPYLTYDQNINTSHASLYSRIQDQLTGYAPRPNWPDTTLMWPILTTRDPHLPYWLTYLHYPYWPPLTTTDNMWPLLTTCDPSWPDVTHTDRIWPLLTPYDLIWPPNRYWQRLSKPTLQKSEDVPDTIAQLAMKFALAWSIQGPSWQAYLVRLREMSTDRTRWQGQLVTLKYMFSYYFCRKNSNHSFIQSLYRLYKCAFLIIIII